MKIFGTMFQKQSLKKKKVKKNNFIVTIRIERVARISKIA